MLTTAPNQLKKNARPGRVLGVALLLCAASVSHGVEVAWSARDGVSPDRACAPWTMVSSVDDPQILGGSMMIRTPTAGSVERQWFYQHAPDLDLQFPIVVEFRARHLSKESPDRDPNYSNMQVLVHWNGSRTVHLQIDEDEVFLWSAPGVKDVPAFADTNDAMHSYRLEIQADDSVTVFQDGAQILTGTVVDDHAGADPAPTYIYFGDGTSEADGEAEWEYVRHNLHAKGCLTEPPARWDAAADLRPDQNCPRWERLERAGIPAVEAPTISNGVMTISTSTTELEKSLFFEQTTPTIRFRYPIVVDFRARYVSGESPDNDPNHSHMQVVVTTHLAKGVVLHIAEDEVFLWNAPGMKDRPAFPDTNDAMHTYRLEIEADDSVTVFQDGEELLTGSALTGLGEVPFRPSIYWGDGTTAAGGVSEWEFFEHNLSAQTADSDGDGTLDACDRDDGLIRLFFQFKEIPAWHQELGSDAWNVYKGDLTELPTTYTQLPESNALADQDCGLLDPSWEDAAIPDRGEIAFYLVSGLLAGIEGSLGGDGDGFERPNDHACP